MKKGDLRKVIMGGDVLDVITLGKNCVLKPS